MLDRSRCVILVPIYERVEPECEASLQKLEDQGYRVRRVNAGAAIDLGRSVMAHQALEDGYEELMWIDSDVVFEADAVDRLRDHDVAMVSAAYPKKATSAFSFHSYRPKIRFGDGGGLIEVYYATTGFLLTRREVYETVRDKCALPLCNQAWEIPFVPYFLPQIIPYGEGHWYLAEDYAFCHRAKTCGYTPYMDTSIRLWHVGRYAYSWEDATGDRQRFKRFDVTINSSSHPDGIVEQGGEVPENEDKKEEHKP
jgi:hypothetical protein